ncbi:MAG: hypothetical protein DRI90_26215 [Deltaproteobacteria bacterium]|nr:MAG: hypothetical protein DRI90_26215 [Deltaproteobacteria bacterium]
MPQTADDVENILYRLNRNFESGGPATFLVSSGTEGPTIAVHVNDPIVVVRVDIGPVPEDEQRQLPLFRQMLEYNAKGLVHCAYAVEGGELVLTSGLALENIDANKLAAVFSDIDLALARHVKTLRALATE